VWARRIYANDEFEYNEIDGVPHYTYAPCLDKEPGDVTHILAVARHADGWFRAEIMAISEVLKIRDRSKSFAKGGGPWKTDPGEMEKKTGIRRLLKTFTDDPGMLELLALDDQDYADETEAISRPATASLDSLTSALAPPPVAEAATEPDEPDSGQAFADYLAGLERCKSASGVKTLYDAIFGEGRTVEWTPAENEAAFQAAEKRTQELKGGGK
jgi:recombinational DNA repair protein RecT